MADPTDLSFLNLLFKPHPWHGIPSGDDVPQQVNAYIEMVPTDTVKYEIDKPSGYLKLDRPQKYSSVCPTLYGFIPQTYCGKQVGAFCSKKTKRKGIVGDGDPLDICVLTDRTITHGDLIIKAIPIGGIRMIDGSEADDKIIAVLKNDALYGSWKDVADCPRALLDRLRHYFLTYKEIPNAEPNAKVEITHIYSKAEAFEVIAASLADYQANFGDATARIQALSALMSTTKKQG